MKDPTKKSRSISAVASSSVDGVDNCGLCFTEVGKTAPGGMGALSPFGWRRASHSFVFASDAPRQPQTTRLGSCCFGG